MKNHVKLYGRIVFAALAIVMFSQVSILGYHIEGLEPIDLGKTELGLPLSDIPEVLDPSYTVENGNIERLRDEETDPSVAIYKNVDGSKSMYLFSEPIWYETESGQKYDYSTQLKVDRTTKSIVSANAGGSLVLPQTIAMQTPISYTEEGITFTMYPIVNSSMSDIMSMSIDQEDIQHIDALNVILAEKTGKAINVANMDAEEHQVEYFKANLDASIVSSAALHGVKNELILDSYNGINRYSFIVDTDGLIPEINSKETIDLFNEEEMLKANLSVESLTDADGRMSFDNSISCIARNDGTYTVTVDIDPEFLEEANYPVSVSMPYVVYPVTESNIEDTYVYSGGPSGTNYSSTKLGVGRVNGYYYRSFVNFSFSNGMRNELSGKTIESCYMRFYEFSSNTSEFMAVTGVPSNTWTASTLTWYNQPSLNTIYGDVYAPLFEGALGSTNTWYSLWCTTNIRAIINNTDSQARGFGIYLHTETASSPAIHYRHFASTNNSDNRPYLIINYS